MSNNRVAVQSMIEQHLRDIITSNGPTEPRYGWACVLNDVVPDGPMVSEAGRTVDEEGNVWAWRSKRQIQEWLEEQGVSISVDTVGRYLKELVDQEGWIRTRPGNPMDKAYAYRPAPRTAD